jgi:hypothetical protein
MSTIEQNYSWLRNHLQQKKEGTLVTKILKLEFCHTCIIREETGQMHTMYSLIAYHVQSHCVPTAQEAIALGVF